MTANFIKNKEVSFDLLTKLYFSMKRIRCVEEKIVEVYPENEIRCPTHLSIGQEAVPAAISACLNKSDYAVSTHRGHAHYLAKGGNLKAMIAELYGKSTGCSKGKGGSMHLIDTDCGFMGTSAIVGNSIPIGVGLGLSISLKQTDNLSCIFLGDGAVEEGVFYESLNFAVLKKLPVLFICENNLYSVYSPLKVRQPENRSIISLASSIGANVEDCDGNDAFKSFNLINKVVNRIRSGDGPWFLEFETYRWREHCGYNYDNQIGYRTEEEFNIWKMRDPIKNLEQKMRNLVSKQLLEKVICETNKKINDEVNYAFTKAKEDPFPSNNEAFKGVYA